MLKPHLVLLLIFPGKHTWREDRPFFSSEQLQRLQSVFEKNISPSHNECGQIADEIGLKQIQVSVRML